MRRTGPATNMSEMGQACPRSVLGILGGGLALKLRRRKRMAPGAGLTCPCCYEGHVSRGEDSHASQPLFPVCSVWPVARERVIVRGFVSPSFHSPNLIRQLRLTGVRLNSSAADKFGARSLRRGADRAQMSAGGTAAQLLRAGWWRGGAVRLVLDLTEGERRAMGDILIEVSEDEPFLALVPPPCLWGREASLHS